MRYASTAHDSDTMQTHTLTNFHIHTIPISDPASSPSSWPPLWRGSHSLAFLFKCLPRQTYVRHYTEWKQQWWQRSCRSQVFSVSMFAFFFVALFGQASASVTAASRFSLFILFFVFCMAFYVRSASCSVAITSKSVCRIHLFPCHCTEWLHYYWCCIRFGHRPTIFHFNLFFFGRWIMIHLYIFFLLFSSLRRIWCDLRSPR